MMAATTCEVHRPSDDQELTKILQNLADPMKTSSQTSFKREFGLLKSKKPAPGTWAYLIDMTPVIQRCCQEKKFWPAAELEYLISQQCISPRNIQMVFETLSERKEIGMMSKALKSQPGGDVPESCLVIALQSFLSSEEEILEKVGNECQPSIKRDDSNDAACPFSTARSTFVDQVLEAPYDDVYLISSLKKLPFTMVLELLKYLLHWMKTSPDQTYVDQLSQWKGHLIDAHATQLVISKDAHEILIQFSKEEDLNKEFVHLATEDLAPLLKVAMTRSTSTGNEAMGQYCIETLHL